jgi:hypothetical protein
MANGFDESARVIPKRCRHHTNIIG